MKTQHDPSHRLRSALEPVSRIFQALHAWMCSHGRRCLGLSARSKTAMQVASTPATTASMNALASVRQLPTNSPRRFLCETTSACHMCETQCRHRALLPGPIIRKPCYVLYNHVMVCNILLSSLSEIQFKYFRDSESTM